MVIWTPQATADLKSIHDYIAKDSPINAKSVVTSIRQKAETLTELPRMGRKLTELEHDDLREIGVHSWRVLYYVKSPDIHVIAVVHKRQELIDLPYEYVNDKET